MVECTREELGNLLHAYELGLLSEDQQKEFEMHLLECDHCFHLAQQTALATRLMKFDQETRRLVRDLGRSAATAPAPSHHEQAVWRWLAPALAIAALALLFVVQDWQLEFQPEAPVMAAENRIAILPFRGLAGPADSIQYGQIISNLLITDLSEVRSLGVVSSQYLTDLTAHMQTSDSRTLPEQAVEIARAARARWLLTGAVAQVSPTLIVTAELVDIETQAVRTGLQASASGDSAVFLIADRLSERIRHTLLEPAALSKEPARPIVEITTQSPEAYHEYLRGLALWQRLSIDEAEPFFRKAVTLDSAFAMPYYYLSFVTADVERRDMIDLAKLHMGGADERGRYLILSRAAFLAGNQEEGIRVLNEFVNRYPDEKQPLLQLAMAEYALKRFSDALNHLQQAVDLDSFYAEAFNQLAYTYERMGDFENAIRAIDRYIALAPDQANPLDSRANLYAMNGRLDRAIESYRQALAIQPDFYNSLHYLGIMCVFMQDYSRAESCFVAFERSRIPSAASASRLYSCYVPAYQGKFNEAIVCIDHGISIDSVEGKFHEVHFKLYQKAVLLEAAGRLPDAIATMEQCVSMTGSTEPGDGNRKRAYLVHLLSRNRQLDQAYLVLTVLKHNLDSLGLPMVSYWDALGSIATAQGRTDSAVYWFDLAARSSGQFYEQLRAGYARLQDLQLADAVESLEKLISQYTSWRLFWSPESVKLHYYLGMAYEESNWFDKAAREYRKFLEIWESADPHNEAVEDARERLQKLRQ